MSIVQTLTHRITRSRHASVSSLHALYADCIAHDGLTPRDSVIDDLATYYPIGSHDDGPGRLRASALLWHAYTMTRTAEPPSIVAALAWLDRHCEGRRHLDVGSGVGVMTELFVRSGWRSTLAEITPEVLDFARFRLGRRRIDATFINLCTEQLPVAQYDAITAFEIFEHVHNVDDAAAALCSGLRPGGFLVVDHIPLREDAAGVAAALARMGMWKQAAIGTEVDIYRSDAERLVTVPAQRGPSD
ncbi:class I SAM-dependent methyltransferase [Pseudonocardia sp. TRM90224]|uniref:class I SAM-dependent methyltransferase n=1 Tax=Pseudonocardia sp. TRM90224 TaxID=2812678 RepID=UPI001E5BD39A|nr:class I SAM-dependent methyltransferase [Pseudonocardia sp. TRM90224]